VTVETDRGTETWHDHFTGAAGRDRAESARAAATTGAGPTRRLGAAGVAGLLAATAVLCLWGLGESGWANSFYSAAAQAGSQSWKAFFYGSSDAANSITVDSNNASGYQLAAGEPVMAIGGFNGTDPSPTLAEFQQYVAAGKIHYFIASGTGGGTQTGGSAAAQEIAAWVAQNYTASTVGGVTVHDLTG
jgi:4-amino-4-deoxy-L-arabinose transferase-like glycosyltransferase